MAPEHEAHPRAFYDHESDAPSRRRRPAADWGVGEDIFDRMPSPRFTRAERRAEHVATPEDRPVRAADEWATSSWDDAAGRRRGESMTIVIGRDESVPEAHRIVVETDDFMAIKPRTDTSEFAAVEAADAGAFAGVVDHATDPVTHHDAAEPAGRRTVKISGHPERFPVVRTQRPPRTAVERIGTSPDRIAAYAVALGFLLVLIAVLTTGQ
jgi:hypothetical protein